MIRDERGGTPVPEIREVTRSMLRCSWALTVLAARGATGGLDPAGATGARESLDRVAAAAEGELDEASRNLYRTGERFQDGVVDLVADMMRAARPWSPAGMLERAGRWLGGNRPSG